MSYRIFFKDNNVDVCCGLLVFSEDLFDIYTKFSISSEWCAKGLYWSLIINECRHMYKKYFVKYFWKHQHNILFHTQHVKLYSSKL